MKYTKEAKKIINKADSIVLWFFGSDETSFSGHRKATVEIGLHFDKYPNVKAFEDKIEVTSWDKKGKPTEWFLKLSTDTEGFISKGFLDQIKQDKEGYTSFTRDDSNQYLPTNGSWLLWNHYTNRINSLFSILPLNSELQFEVALDNSNSYLCKHKLHKDELHLFCTKNGKKLEFLLDDRVVEHNTARFGASLLDHQMKRVNND